MNSVISARMVRLGRIMMDPFIFLVGMLITFAILLDAMNSNFLYVFQIVNVANQSLALSEILATLIPMSMISILTIVASLVRTMLSLLQNSRALRPIPVSSLEGYVFLTLFFFAGTLTFILVIQILELKNLVTQSTPVSGDRYYIIVGCVGVTIFLTTLISVVLSARDVVISDISKSI